MKKSKSYSRNRKEATICALMIIIFLVLFLIFPSRLLYNLFLFSMPAGFGFLYITFLKDFYRELKETRLKTKKVELAIGIVYSIMFGMTVILILYGIISVIINSECISC